MEVVWHTTAQDGVQALEAGSFHLLVLDVGLPDGSGFDLCRELRRRSAIPIIFVTARKSEIDRVVGLELGADDYVVKPFSPRELAARVRAVIRRSKEPEPSVPPALPSTAPSPTGFPFAVDPERREIRFHGALLPLSRYEYQLLKVMMAHPGRVFSRDALMEAAWDDPGASLDRTVDTHIKSIRAKLRAVRADAEPIRTCRGVGYALE